MSKARWETPDIASMIRRPLNETTLDVSAGYPPGLSDPLGRVHREIWGRDVLGAELLYDVPAEYLELYGMGTKK
jgi:hypothetical protein